MYVRKSPPYKKSGEACYAVISFGVDVLVKANLLTVIRMDAVLENGSITFFKPTLPSGGWAVARPKKGKSVHLRVRYVEGLPFILNDSESYKLKELAIDAEKQTITVATTIGEPKNARSKISAN